MVIWETKHTLLGNKNIINIPLIFYEQKNHYRHIGVILIDFCMAKPKAVRLVTENMENPLGLPTHTPRFSWQLTEAKKNTMQTAYRIMVASAPELLKEGRADLWDSGMVQSDESIWINYAGKALKDNQRCFWTVQVKTNNGTTDWAEPQEFGIGLTADSHWAGRWVGIDHLLEGESLGYKTRVNARYLRGEIELNPAKTVKRATAYVGVLGLYEFYVMVKDKVLMSSLLLRQTHAVQ